MASIGRCGNLLTHNIARDGRKSFSSGLGGLFWGMRQESDFYDLTIFVDLSNSGPTEFHGGNAKDITVLLVGYSFRSDVIFAQGYEITNITPDRVNCPDPDPIARAAAYHTCRPMFLDYKLDP